MAKMKKVELLRKVREAISSFKPQKSLNYYSGLAEAVFGENYTQAQRREVKEAAFRIFYGEDVVSFDDDPESCPYCGWEGGEHDSGCLRGIEGTQVG